MYRSNDNQNTFEYVNDCTVLNGICEFKTSHFSVFTIFEKNAVLQG
ncbi:MAG: hypothetical protein LBQ59_02275 [Candidatus Peribacteria bacterium]|nr:hypothetical protein [Candidatus Peribacteria bacterium]